jgi:hypothetical protein
MDRSKTVNREALEPTTAGARRSANEGRPSLQGVATDMLYPVETAKSLLGMSSWSWRTQRRRGLRVLYVGNRSYVSGSEICRHFEEQSREATNDN